MGRYVDGFVTPVRKDRLNDYIKLARLSGKVWKEYGALEYVECVTDDVSPGKRTSFPRSVKLKEDEVVVFSWVTYKSQAARNRILKQVMADPRLAQIGVDSSIPFDAKRMFWGGFKTIVDM